MASNGALMLGVKGTIVELGFGRYRDWFAGQPPLRSTSSGRGQNA